MRPAFSTGAYQVMQLAQEAAGSYRHRFVHTEHLLLGLLEERNSATLLLKSLGYERRSLRRACEARCEYGHHQMEANLKTTSRVDTILALAAEQMAELGHEKIDSRHLLLGMLLEEEGIAGQILREAGLTYEDARAEMVAPGALSEAPARIAARPARPAATPQPFWRRWLRT
jgi:ATP-dependent Clp protease ATP-binding subunit ClpC